jgi:hypothetical protein
MPVSDVPWTKEQDEVLREGVLRYGTGSWDKIAQHMGNYGRTPQCCTQRWEIVKESAVKVQNTFVCHFLFELNSCVARAHGLEKRTIC